MIQHGEFNMLEMKFNAILRDNASNMNLAPDVEEGGRRRAKNHFDDHLRTVIKLLSDLEKESKSYE